MESDVMDFGMEADVVEENEFEKYTLLKSIAEVGTKYGGKPTIDITRDVVVDEIPKKYSYAFLTITNETAESYLNIRMNFPKMDKDGYIHNLNKKFEFFREGFNFVLSLQKIISPESIINPKTNEEINFIKKFNMEQALNYVASKEHVDIEVTHGPEDSEYNSFRILRMD